MWAGKRQISVGFIYEVAPSTRAPRGRFMITSWSALAVATSLRVEKQAHESKEELACTDRLAARFSPSPIHS